MHLLAMLLVVSTGQMADCSRELDPDLCLAKQRRFQEQAEAAARGAEDREREAQARRERLEEKRKRSRDPKWLGPALSARRCYHSLVRAEAIKEIQTEKRYAKLGGVVDMRKLHDLQTFVRTQDEGIANADGALARWKLKPSSCSGKLVSEITRCLRVAREQADDDAGTCSEVQDYIELLMPSESDR